MIWWWLYVVDIIFFNELVEYVGTKLSSIIRDQNFWDAKSCKILSHFHDHSFRCAVADLEKFKIIGVIVHYYKVLFIF